MRLVIVMFLILTSVTPLFAESNSAYKPMCDIDTCTIPGKYMRPRTTKVNWILLGTGTAPGPAYLDSNGRPYSLQVEHLSVDYARILKDDLMLGIGVDFNRISGLDGAKFTVGIGF